MTDFVHPTTGKYFALVYLATISVQCAFQQPLSCSLPLLL